MEAPLSKTFKGKVYDLNECYFSKKEAKLFAKFNRKYNKVHTRVIPLHKTKKKGGYCIYERKKDIKKKKSKKSCICW